MEFEVNFNQYIMKCIEKWKGYPLKEIYKNIIKDIKSFILLSCSEKVKTSDEMKTLENELVWQTKNLEPNEQPHYIIASTGKRKPHGYSRLMEACQEKESDMIRFIDIFLTFKEMMIGYNKEYHLKFENLIVLCALLEVVVDSFMEHLEEYKKQMQEMKEKLQNNEVPTLKKISRCEELQIFLQETFINGIHPEDLTRKRTIKSFLSKDENKPIL